jgi:LmbE family N-acetylglucosaminyl deacetylase
VLVLAPHPDDESIGCGGTIRLLVNLKKSVKVLFLTSGDKADSSHPASKNIHQQNHISDYSILREKEAERALGILGVTDYTFLRFPDRELHAYYEKVLEMLFGMIQKYSPDAIYSPSMIELNPDHRTTATLAAGIQKKILESGDAHRIPKVLFYEVTTPIRPNILVDVTSTYSTKVTAIKRYASQLHLRDYFKYSNALNIFRALTVNGPEYVEAFWMTERNLSDGETATWTAYQTKRDMC